MGDEPADPSLLQPLIQAAHDECPSVGSEEDFLPHDPRFDVRVEWAGEMFRMVAGTLERPTSDIETLRRVARIIDPVLHEHTDYGLTDIVELMLRRVDAVACGLAATWPVDLDQELRSSPQLQDDELAAAAALPSLGDQIAQCSSPERARAALEAHSVPAKSLRRDEMSMIATFGSTIAIRHGQEGFTPLPTGLIVEAFNALAGELAATALALDTSLEYKWLTAAWRFVGGLLAAAGLDVIGPLHDERYPYLHSVIRYSDSQYLAVSIAAGLDHRALQETIRTAATHLETVRVGSILMAADGPVSIPASAKLCQLLIVAPPQAATLQSPDGARCALITLQDLDWIRRTIGRDEIDLWYFARDRVRQPRIGEVRSWDGIDLWEAWRSNGKSFYRGARAIDVLQIEPHHSLREWQKASEQRDIEQALDALGMGRISTWPLHSLDGDSKLVGNAQKGALFQLVVCDTPIAVALHPCSGSEPFPHLAHDLGQCIAYKLECVRDRLVNLMRSSERRSLKIDFAFEDDARQPAVRVANLDDSTLTFGCSPDVVDLLQTDSRSVEAQFGLLLAEAIARDTSIEDFTDAWRDAPAGIRFDAFTVGPRVQETPEAASLHESHRSARPRGTRRPVGAGNSAVVVDVPRCGPMLSPRVPNLVPIPGITGSAHCALRSLEGPRDHRVAPPTRCAAPASRPTRTHRRRPELARSDRGRARAAEPNRVAGHPRHAVALAPAPHRPALDPTTATAGPTVDLSGASPTRTASRSRESDLGIPPHPRRTRWARPPPRCIHGLADPQQRRYRPRPHTLGSHLVAVVAVPGRRRLRLRHHRNRAECRCRPAANRQSPAPRQSLKVWIVAPMRLSWCA